MRFQKLVSPILMWIIVVLGVFAVFNTFPRVELFQRNTITSFFIFPAGIYWLYFFLSALKSNRKAAFSIDKTVKIIKSGVYGVVRHPIYSADIILGWGIFLFWPIYEVLLSVVWLTLILSFWMILEENALEDKFRDEYRNYKRETPMFFPRIFRIKR